MSVLDYYKSWCTTLPIDLGHKGLQLKLEPHKSSSNAVSSREGQYRTHRSNGISKGNQRVCYNRLTANYNVQVVEGVQSCLEAHRDNKLDISYYPRSIPWNHEMTTAKMAIHAFGRNWAYSKTIFAEVIRRPYSLRLFEDHIHSTASLDVWWLYFKFFSYGTLQSHCAWHLYPDWNTGCWQVYGYIIICKDKDGKGCSTRNRAKEKGLNYGAMSAHEMATLNEGDLTLIW